LNRKKKIEDSSFQNLLSMAFKKIKKGQGGHPHSFIKDYAEFLDIDEYEKFVGSKESIRPGCKPL
jgi:hypothetical protein